MNTDTPEPLTEAERAHYQALAEKGDYPPLEIVRRFVATIRKSILASPAKVAKTKKSRVKETKAEDVGFF